MTAEERAKLQKKLKDQNRRSEREIQLGDALPPKPQGK